MWKGSEKICFRVLIEKQIYFIDIVNVFILTAFIYRK